MKTIHLIQHTHWDREWYFTENDSKALLYYFMDDLMSNLEQDNNIGPFVLDAQTVVLDDYFQVAPEHKERLEKLIKNQRILIGPWYTQTDFLTVSAESITRNLLLGMSDCEKYGQAMKIGYVPDSFGQTEQLPMLLNQFNIDRAVLWRGWSERLVANTEFQWQSQDGSEITTAVFPWGYGCSKWLPTDPMSFTEAITSNARKQCQFAASEHVMLPNGNDQSPFEFQVVGLLDHANQTQDEFHFVNSSFDGYFDALVTAAPTLNCFKGEMLDPKYMRIHRGIFSTRMDIKLANEKLETLVSRYLEPLLTLNYTNGLTYPQNAVNQIWREAMKSHAHDSIGGCNSDRVNSMVLNRLLSGIETAEQLLELNFRKLTQGIQASVDGTKIVVFNSVPKKRDSLVEVTIYTPSDKFKIVDQQGNELQYQIIDESQQDMSTIIQELSNNTTTTWYRKISMMVSVKDIPACGYTTIYLQEDKPSATNSDTIRSQESVISNQWFTLEYQTNGTLHLIDHRNGAQYPNLFEICDGSDEGDNYNFSPLLNDWVISSKNAEHTVFLETDVLTSTMTLNFTMVLPKNLDERKQHIASTRLPISLRITLRNDRPSIDVDVDLDNCVLDHRLQINFPTGIECSQHVADQPFGLVTRENVPSELDIWQQESWTEAPVANYPMQSMVLHRNALRGLGVVTKGLREYEFHQDTPNSIAITLLRSVGWLGQANLTYRPGRASGMVLPAPDSQIQGRHQFSLSLVPFCSEEEADYWQTVECINTPVISHVGTDWARFRLNPTTLVVPESQSLVEWNNSLHFSTLKKSEHSEQIILRAFNPTLSSCEFGDIQTPYSYQNVQLDERSPVEQTADIPPCRPVTISLATKAL
ncbi:glycoside hydrolase family 38 C-terminal domain-containing protein [Vibrio mediterranei]